MVREWIETGNATVLTDEHLTGWIAGLFSRTPSDIDAEVLEFGTR